MRFMKTLVVASVGTFALVFIGAGAVVASDPANFAVIAVACGPPVMTSPCSFGMERNSYPDSALTLGTLMTGQGSFAAASPVLLARFAGGTSGGLAIASAYGLHTGQSLGMATANLDVSSLAGSLCLEVIGSLLLMTIFLNTARRSHAGKFTRFTVGMTVAFRIISFCPVTGAAVNFPERALGPAIAAGEMTGLSP
jgi:glycerol uptake facilitator-like aquaporin